MYIRYSSINAHKIFCNKGVDVVEKGVEFKTFKNLGQFFDDF